MSRVALLDFGRRLHATAVLVLKVSLVALQSFKRQEDLPDPAEIRSKSRERRHAVDHVDRDFGTLIEMSQTAAVSISCFVLFGFSNRFKTYNLSNLPFILSTVYIHYFYFPFQFIGF